RPVAVSRFGPLPSRGARAPARAPPRPPLPPRQQFVEREAGALDRVGRVHAPVEVGFDGRVRRIVLGPGRRGQPGTAREQQEGPDQRERRPAHQRPPPTFAPPPPTPPPPGGRGLKGPPTPSHPPPAPPARPPPPP